MIDDITERAFTTEDGHTYQVEFAPLERGMRSLKLGVDPRLKAIIFTREDGWMASAPIYHTAALWALDRLELEHFFEIAVMREHRRR